MSIPRVASRRHARVQVDLAISDARRRLRYERSRQAFDALTTVARRGDRLAHPFFLGHPEAGHPAVSALRHIARFAPFFRADPWDWRDGAASAVTLVSSIANHVFGRDVPVFLSFVWYERSEERRKWFVDYAGGASFRSLDLPIPLTRRMEHVFLRSPDHLDVMPALRRAELIGLGASVEWADSLAHLLARDMRFAELTRPFVHFLARHEGRLTRADAAACIAFFHVDVLGDGDAPRRPAFTLRGRTPASLVRLAREWRARRRAERDASLRSYWRSSQRAMTFEPRAGERWRLSELRTPRDLVVEGQRMRHCVATYVPECSRGSSRIWSLRRPTPRGMKPVVTIEVDPRAKKVVEAFAFANRAPDDRALAMIAAWASREGLDVDID